MHSTTEATFDSQKNTSSAPQSSYKNIFIGESVQDRAFFKKNFSNREDSIFLNIAAQKREKIPFFLSSKNFAQDSSETHQLKDFKLWHNKEWIPFDSETLKKYSSEEILQWNYFTKEKLNLIKNYCVQKDALNEERFPIKTLIKNENSWSVISTDNKEITGDNIIWSPDIQTFKEVFSRESFQDLLSENTHYSEKSEDYSGGLIYSWELKSIDAQKVPLLSENLLGIPVKHRGHYYLSLCALEKENTQLKSLFSLTYLPKEILNTPKELSFFHKSLKRSMKTIWEAFTESSSNERWEISRKLPGHFHTNRSSLSTNKSEAMNLYFIGENNEEHSEEQVYGTETFASSYTKQVLLKTV